MGRHASNFENHCSRWADIDCVQALKISGLWLNKLYYIISHLLIKYSTNHLSATWLNNTFGRFHQRLTHAFFVRKHVIWHQNFIQKPFAPKFCTKNARIKRWWNWPLWCLGRNVKSVVMFRLVKFQLSFNSIADTAFTFSQELLKLTHTYT